MIIMLFTCLIHSTRISPHISRRNAITRAAMQNLDNRISKSNLHFHHAKAA